MATGKGLGEEAAIKEAHERLLSTEMKSNLPMLLQESLRPRRLLKRKLSRPPSSQRAGAWQDAEGEGAADQQTSTSLRILPLAYHPLELHYAWGKQPNT